MDTEQQDIAVIQQLIDRHFEIWNELDATKRVPQYSSLYTRACFVADYSGITTGHSAMEKKVHDLQAKHQGFMFSPKPLTWNHGIGRVTWGYGPESAPNLIRGEDIFTISEGKLASLYVFLDKNS